MKFEKAKAIYPSAPFSEVHRTLLGLARSLSEKHGINVKSRNSHSTAMMILAAAGKVQIYRLVAGARSGNGSALFSSFATETEIVAAYSAASYNPRRFRHSTLSISGAKSILKSHVPPARHRKK